MWQILVLVFGFINVAALAAPTSDPSLHIAIGEQKRDFSRTDLLHRKDLETLVTKNDPAYPGTTQTYQVVPVSALFEGLTLPFDSVIQFRCLDGFSAPISKERLLTKASGKSRAYIAIEPAAKPWAPIKKNGPSPGPFYLVWAEPQLSQIGPEEWPFQLAALEAKGSFAALYPKIMPDARLAANDPIRHGFEVFAKNCFACHTLNKEGMAQVGPDLNLPMNPTEYLVEGTLRKLIRDPQSLRYFPNSRMNGFGPDTISEAELSDLIAYLRHMAAHKN